MTSGLAYRRSRAFISGRAAARAPARLVARAFGAYRRDMTLDVRSLDVLRDALLHLDRGFAGLDGAIGGMPVFDATPDEAELARLRSVLFEVAERMRDNFPYPHPLYAGQMLKPPHAVARLAYALAQHVNPNNHALDGGRASSAMEKEAVAEIARMFGWGTHLGHLTSAGTVAPSTVKSTNVAWLPRS